MGLQGRSSGIEGVSKSEPHVGTTRLERTLLVLAITLLPLENYIPAVAGFSILFVIFAVIGFYAVLNRPHFLNMIWMHPVFVAIYICLSVFTLLEFASPLSDYREIASSWFTTAGAVVVASLCRDRRALKACLYGYIVAAVWLGVVLFSTSYGTLAKASASTFHEAGKIRVEALGENPINNLNSMAFTCVQGGTVAFVFALFSRAPYWRISFSILALFCLVAASLPMSRMAVLVTIVTSGVVLYSYGVKHVRALVFVVILASGIYAFVPDVVWSRMEVRHEPGKQAKMESRERFYLLALEYMDEYLIFGVGSGNYWHKWASEKGFSRRFPGGEAVFGAHNSFLQLAMNWGVLGLSTYLFIIWRGYRCIPVRCGNDVLALSIVGISVSLFVQLFFGHNFLYKGTALAFGMLVGGRYWIWTKGCIPQTNNHTLRQA
jgi:hypothetical protein